jgi:thioredoxin-dependent peroxiredoxin
MNRRAIEVTAMAALSFLTFLEPKLAFGSRDGVPQVGDVAPDAVLTDQDGADVRLSDLWSEQPLVIYFYPKDNTPGCTAQACSFRDANDDLRAAGLSVVGISLDTAESHRRFAERHRLSFTLLADPEATVTEAYGVKGSFFGLGIARRVTFLVGTDGRVLRVWDPASPANHAEEVLAESRDLGVVAEAS